MIAKLAQLFIQRRASIPRSEALRTLGFSPTEEPNLSEITTAWKKAVMKHHPDRGGDLGTMQLVNLSYDILKGKTRAAPEPSSYTQQSTYTPPPRPQPSPEPPYGQPRNTHVPFNSVVPTPPTGVEWVCATTTVVMPAKNYTSDDSESSLYGFALVGKTAEHAYVWAFVHRAYKSGYTRSMSDKDVWSFSSVRVPVSQFGTPKFERAVKEHLNSAIRGAESGVAAQSLSTLKGAYDASGLLGKPTLENLSRIRTGSPKPLAAFLRPGAAAKAPTTTIVKVEWKANPIYNFQELIVIVNNDRFPLSQEDTRKLEYSGFLNKVFGSYYYSGDVKLVNRLKNRSQVYMALAKMDSLPRNIQTLLLNLA